MKSTLLKTAFATLLGAALVNLPGMAKAEIDLSKDFDSLGGNEKLIKRAKSLDPNNRMSIVQRRVVDRTLRLELGVNYGGEMGGDSYYNTQNLGGNIDFHINPRWSLGGRYYRSFNNLTSEGEALYEDARAKNARGETNYNPPDLVSPTQTMLGVINWYPVYGKTNLFDRAVAQFDVYTLIGYGQTQLVSSLTKQSRWTDVVTAGGGIGMWLTQHLATRLEGRWETYEDSLHETSRRMNVGIATISLGLLL